MNIYKSFNWGTGHKLHHCWWIMAACCIIMACGLGLLYNSAGIFLIPVSETLGVGRGPISLYLTIMTLMMTLTLPLAGRILSKYRIERILSLAFLINYLVFASLSLAKSVSYFYIAGAIMGIANACSLIIPVPILINNWFKKKLGLVLGIALACSGIGGIIFNTVGSLIIENYGWRAAYISLAVIGAVLVLPCTLFIIRTKPEDMGLQPYGAEEDSPGNRFLPNSAPSPQLPKKSLVSIIHTLPFIWSFTFTAAVTLAGSLQNHIPAFSISLGFSPTVGALAVSALMIGVITCKIGVGLLNDRFGVVAAMLSGVSAGLIGAILLLYAKSGVGILLAGSFLFGIIPGLTVVAPPLFVRKIVSPEDYNYVLSYVSMGNTLFNSIGVSLYGFIFDLNNSYWACFAIIFSMILISFISIYTAADKKHKGYYQRIKSPCYEQL